MHYGFRLRDYEHESHPHDLAENVSPSGLLDNLKKYDKRSRPNAQLHSAWNYVECALNRYVDIDDGMRTYYLDYAQDLTGKIINSARAPQDTLLSAAVLSSYIPVFQKRATGSEVQSSDCKQLYRSIGAAISHVQPLDSTIPPAWRMTETAMLAISARISQPHLLMYPTSQREESSRNALFNHDTYFVKDQHRVPVQQKYMHTNHEYDSWVQVMLLDRVFEKAYRKASIGKPDNPSDQLNHILSLVAVESHGVSLSREEQVFMNALGESVAYPYVNAA